MTRRGFLRGLPFLPFCGPAIVKAADAAEKARRWRLYKAYAFRGGRDTKVARHVVFSRSSGVSKRW